MRVDSRSVEGFLNRPPTARVVLLFGPDEELVRSRADRITKTVTGVRDDPFRVAWLFKEDHGRLQEEATAIAMMGGRRVIRVRDTAEGLLPSLMRVMDGPGDSVVVLEADNLTKRSKLRLALEGAANAAVIACYPAEGAALQALATQYFQAAGAVLGQGALAEFLARAGGDAAVLRGEAEKLALYAGPGAVIQMVDVQSAVGDQALGSIDDALYAVTAGRTAEMDRALESALEAGAAPVMLCRMVIGHLSRLLEVAEACAAGSDPGQAARGLRPPLLYTRMAAFLAAVPLWSAARTKTAIAAAVAAELACKQTGARDSLIVRRLMLSMALQASRVRAGVR